MNRLEELLVVLQEECAEVSQAASKSIRFGLDATYQDRSNRARLESEIGDLMAMIKLVTEEGNLNPDNMIAAAEAKLIKVEKFMKNGKPNEKRTHNKRKI
jgi:NTP pyrophosphatase (non-canonical NTP hydrolase)